MCSNKHNRARPAAARRGGLLAACRQVGYFDGAASCVINSLHTESSDSSPVDTVCFGLFLFFLGGFLAAQGHWMSVSPCVAPISAARIIHTVCECGPTRGRGLPPDHVSTFVRQILHLIRLPARTTLAITNTKQQQRQQKNDLFPVRLAKKRSGATPAAPTSTCVFCFFKCQP